MDKDTLHKGFEAAHKALPFEIDIWNRPFAPGFTFQKYNSLENAAPPHEALAVLKTADGLSLSNKDYFDAIRAGDAKTQIRVDRFLIPLAVESAVRSGILPVAVNVHLATLLGDGFADFAEDLLDTYNLDRRAILYEIVEPHVPSAKQAAQLERLSSRANPEKGFVLIIDDYNFQDGTERLHALAPFAEIVKIDLDHASVGIGPMLKAYPHLSVVLENVAADDHHSVLRQYPGVAVQGY